MPPTPGCLANWGKNWTQCADESKLTELSDGRLAMVIRHWAHPVLSISDTHGETWLAPVSITSIDMPECQSSIRQMVNVVKIVLLIRDMTDTMYNSQMRPFVNHFRGTDLVVEHVEKYWCPTIESTDFMGGSPFRFREDPLNGKN